MRSHQSSRLLRLAGFCAASLLAAVAIAPPAWAETPEPPPPCETGLGTVAFDGEARFGSTVRAVPSGWTIDPGPTTYSYQWFSGGVFTSIDEQYTPQASEIGLGLEVVVTAASETDPTCTITGSKTQVTASLGKARLTMPPVTITGGKLASHVLTGTVGSFGDQPTENVTYRWLRDGAPIAKAKKLAYTLTGEDVGHTITLRVAAAAAYYDTGVTVSNGIGPVGVGTFAKVTAKVKGAHRVGSELVAKPKSRGTGPATDYAYQWLRNGKKIKGATEETYLVTAKDVGKRIRVKVTAQRDGFKERSAKSKATKRIPRLPLWVDERCMTAGKVLCIDKNPNDRKVRYLINGRVIKTLDARFGASGTPTREGVYTVYMKSRDHYSTLFNTSMPYAMFFSGGQAVHYSPDFAARGYSGASHGCVNTRDRGGIQQVFDSVEVGTKVVVYH
jgi:lipoprotein-anchoring transpeptidase ErfK/SrfK